MKRLIFSITLAVMTHFLWANSIDNVCTFNNLSSTFLTSGDTIWVNKKSGNDKNSGAWGKPVRTIQKGIDLSKDGNFVGVSHGIYKIAQTINVTKAISLIGGFKDYKSTPLQTQLISITGTSVISFKHEKGIKFYNFNVKGIISHTSEKSYPTVNANDCTVEFKKITITAPPGTLGKNGISGTAGISGDDGTSGGHNQTTGGIGGWGARKGWGDGANGAKKSLCRSNSGGGCTYNSYSGNNAGAGSTNHRAQGGAGAYCDEAQQESRPIKKGL